MGTSLAGDVRAQDVAVAGESSDQGAPGVAEEIDIDDTGSLIFRRGTGHAAPGAVIGRRRERWVASPSMRVLGVDPGLTRCGLGLVEGTGGRSVRAVAVDVVRTPPDDELAARLGLVADVVERWIAEHRPDVVAVESVFAQHNVRTVMGTAQVGGVVALVAGRAGLPVAFHTPSEVKAAVTGSGRADKAQLTTMITRVLALAEAPQPADAADALALAVCHCWRAPMMARMAVAEARAAEVTKHHRPRLAAARRAARS